MSAGNNITDLSFNDLLEIVPEAIFTFQIKAQQSVSFPYASSRLTQIVGVSPDEVKEDASTFLERIHPAELASFFAAAEESERFMTLWQMEFQLEHPEKGTVWVEWQASPLNQNGELYWRGFLRDITKQKRNEIAMSEQAIFQNTLVNALSDVGMQQLVIEEGRVIHVGNRALAYEFGFSDAQIDAHPPLELLIHPDDRERVMDYHRRRIAGEAVPENYELSMTSLSGERRVHQVTVTVVPGSVPVRVITIGIDVTERRRIEEALLRSEREFRSLAESSPDFVIRCDRELRIRYLNTRLLDYVGSKTAQELLGRKSIEIWPDGRFDAVDAIRTEAMQSGKPTTLEPVLQTPEGGIQYHQIVAVPERDTDDNIIGTITFGRDVTHIRESERRLDHFVESLPGMAYTFRMTPDGHGSFPYASSGIQELYGLTPEQVKDDMGPIHASAHADDRPRIEAAIAESARTMMPLHIESRIIRPDHPERWIDVRSTPEQQPDGTIVWYGIMLDITRLKEHQERLNHIAHHDELTRLPNRLLLMDRLSQALAQTNRTKEKVAVFYLDLDGFKPINDKYGHEMGDRVLVEVANRVSSILRLGDTFARLGGDEFVAVLVGIPSLSKCELMAQRLLETISHLIRFDEHSLQISCSIGISIYPDDDANDVNTLLRYADQAMYSAKEVDNSKFVFWSQSTHRG